MRNIVTAVTALAALAACQRTHDPAVADIVAYRCGDLEVAAVFTELESAVLTIDDRTLTLTSVPAASGAKYADGEGNEFWTKGLEQGLLTLAGEAQRSCTAQAR
jgi:membrane-bound inhibitor of C-type lysozyme